MALRLNRTVTVHCVRAYGDILKHFKQYNKMIESQVKNEAKEEGVGYKYKGTPIIMHSYGGSKEITKSLLKLTNLNVYFSLSLKRSE
jgi:Tat protein secretion system quality control protein TatD with DNase activity